MSTLRKTTKQFITEAKAIHGTKYMYTRTKYIGALSKVVIKCPKHGYWKQTPANHLTGYGCTECGVEANAELRSSKMTTSKFIQKAKSTHSNKYTYARTEYIRSANKVIITCKTHGDFLQTPNNHLSKRAGCPKCDGRGKTTESFIQLARKTHGKLYLYPRLKYTDCYTNVQITCKIHGDFFQSPGWHLAGQGCPSCGAAKSPKRYSKISQEWIKSYAHSHRMKNIKHAESGGEYCIPSTLFIVDGYHRPSNTVFEFHGDCFHGNPDIYKPRSKPNPYSSKTAQRLYKETIKRMKIIQSLGYNIVYIWENDYRNGEPATLLKAH